MVAGEASGDMNAAGVARALKAGGAPFDLVGVGGEQMKAAGVRLLEHINRLTVMGFAGILAQVPKHWVLLNDIRLRLRTGQVALVILVDYGGFNLHVAAAARAEGVPVLYFITPQVWASRPGRIRDLADTVTKAAVIFRFEEALLRGHGIEAEFVGHPMLDRAATMPSRAEARTALGLSDDRPLLAMFPGSRDQEIDRNLDDFVDTARRVRSSRPELDVVVGLAPTVRIDPARCPFRIVAGDSWRLLRAADAALCKSGTITLEATVAGCPFVIGYRAGTIDYAIARQIATVKHIGMPNVIAGRMIVPEYVQDDLDPATIAPVLLELLDPSSPRRAQMLRDLAEIRATLGEPGAAERVATIARALADAPRPTASNG